MHTDERRISAVHAFGNNIMRVHDVSTFKATQFAPLLNEFRKKFPGDPWRDTEPGRQAICEDFANGLIKGTHSCQSDKFVLWVCDELSLKSRVIVLRRDLQSSRLFVREEGSLGGFPSCSSVRLYKILICRSCDRSVRCWSMLMYGFRRLWMLRCHRHECRVTLVRVVFG